MNGRREIIDLPSPNHGPRPDSCPVDLLLIHYTGMTSAAAALDRLREPAAEVSAHYLVDEDGSVFRLVAEDRRAWHAGVSSWSGRDNVNDFSVGIELVNPGHEFGYRPFPKPQMQSLAELAIDICARHRIPPDRVLAHSDVAPLRKQDPGELFDWAWLARQRVGLWPPVEDRAAAAVPPDRNGPAAEDEARRLLRTIGYEVSGMLPPVVAAFQRHFLPDRVSGRADPATLVRLREVSAAFDH